MKNVTEEMISIPMRRFTAVVVGSGAAALNGADWLYDLGVCDICIVTEGMNCGTSRNTGSDKQTYYKISTSFSAEDSVKSVAQTLFNGGCVHGDHALCEAACSLECFYKLKLCGVNFPEDQYGIHPGYKTDHDLCSRASSAGPLTSKYMTEALERRVRAKNIPVFDGYFVIELLTDVHGAFFGLLCVDKKDETLVIIRAKYCIYASGGPSAVYSESVYPKGHHGMSGALLKAGVKLANMTEGQFGIASKGFRWNISGSYQQVVPRYVFLDDDGVFKEFLNRYFSSDNECFDDIFKKGYQWPFDSEKISGSSKIDLCVYDMIARHGKRVFLDFTRDPSGFGSRKLGAEALEYFNAANIIADGTTPAERLCQLNIRAYELFLSHGIDLKCDMLEITVASQHINGGADVDMWWETAVPNLFAAGECAGTHGIKRPGGSALNSGQVGSMRAAQKIAERYVKGVTLSETLMDVRSKKAISSASAMKTRMTLSQNDMMIEKIFDGIQREMSVCAAFLRFPGKISRLRERIAGFYAEFTEKGVCRSLISAYLSFDAMLVQLAILSSMEYYFGILDGGSRGGSLIVCGEEELPLNELEFKRSKDIHADRVITAELLFKNGLPNVICADHAVRSIPAPDECFENVMNSMPRRKS